MPPEHPAVRTNADGWPACHCPVCRRKLAEGSGEPVYVAERQEPAGIYSTRTIKLGGVSAKDPGITTWPVGARSYITTGNRAHLDAALESMLPTPQEQVRVIYPGRDIWIEMEPIGQPLWQAMRIPLACGVVVTGLVLGLVFLIEALL